jgi:hypothetical protein
MTLRSCDILVSKHMKFVFVVITTMSLLASLGKDILGIIYAHLDIVVVLKLSHATREMYRLLLVILKNNVALRRQVAMHICGCDYRVELLAWMLPGLGHEYINECFKFACIIGSPMSLRVLLKRCDPCMNKCWAIKFACQKGNINTIKALLEDPRTKDSKGAGMVMYTADRSYTRWGETNVIKTLMRDERFIKKQKGWYMLYYAIKHKDHIALKLMLRLGLVVATEHMEMIREKEWQEGEVLIREAGK